MSKLPLSIFGVMVYEDRLASNHRLIQVFASVVL
ncbi:hypothetical protein FHR70_003025 [Microvirga lupini]|uniref:Uncharacterized protein n=1 Tax=Microvirga lupini TaxID=420324 RepID=A0A7W4VMK7_9HYPH|nr:hypothetical protein [Microvirga lupini]